MKTIGELLSRDLQRPIEEIIKVDQTDESSVYTEIKEYVATERIQDQYRDILKAIAEAPADPSEGIGVWISGFFGSGKSSFAKNLGYILANRNVLTSCASDLFKEQIDSKRINELIDFINQAIPTEVIMFDVSVDRAVKRSTERIAEVMYTVLLRELGYAEDYDVAELEIELERESKLDSFVAHCQEKYEIEWRVVRKGAQKISRASAILHDLYSETYATPDSWSQSLRGKSADITVGKFVERAFDLCERRRPGKALVFIVDEVGQYVARSADKIEDLRAIVEQFGKVGKNLRNAKKIVSPAWVIVTSQEKLDEVVAAIDDKRVELAKLQDRFKHRIDMAPADIQEVATKRVLAKKQEAESILRKQYQDFEGLLNVACRWERTTRRSSISWEDFFQFYPYLPHFIELSIDIMSGIRLQPGAPRHLGGSNRTIIKQAYEMLVSERTALKDKPVGTLVTLDKIFELVEGNLSTEKQKDISDITQRFKDYSDDKGIAARVSKAIALLEFVRDLPRTEQNIAACLVEQVGQPAPLTQVREALKRLENAQFVRNTEEGWKLQTAQEKNWETERRGYLSPKPRDRNEIMRSVLQTIFSEPKLRTYRYKDLRTFQVGIKVDGNQIGHEGHIPLSICTADEQDFIAKVAEYRNESRQEAHKYDNYWIFRLTEEIDRLVAERYASRQMVNKYDQMRVQNRATNEELACLQDEKTRVLRIQGQLEQKVSEAMQNGTSLFQGVSKDGADLGKSLGDIFKGLFDFTVPSLYPKLEMGARSFKDTAVEEILKAANLNGLSQIFYDGEQGLRLVIKDGSKFVPNPEADVAKEVLDYLNQQYSYGNKETRTGKALESRFGGIGYGWERDLLRLILAVLFRAGSIEVLYKQRFDSYQDPRSREAFTSNTAFKAALFTPVKPISLSTLKQAVESYEELTGDTADMDKNDVAVKIKKLAGEELNSLFSVETQARLKNLPILEQLKEYRDSLTAIQNGTAEDCVQILVGEGTSLKEARERMRKIRDATSYQAIERLDAARQVIGNQWAAVSLDQPGLVQVAERLQFSLDDPSFYEQMDQIQQDAQEIATAYAKRYCVLHQKRAETYLAAIAEVKGRSEWTSIPTEQQEPLLSELRKRSCSDTTVTKDGWSLTRNDCPHCRAGIAQMESDLAALVGLKSQVLVRIQELIAQDQQTEIQIERVRVADFAPDPIESEEAVELVVERLREYLLSLLSKGTKIFLE